MASNKDILNAQQFNRRRLVTAFSAGAPGGREVEPKGIFAPLIAGSIIALVMLLVPLVISRFDPTLPDGWQNNTLVVVEGQGSRYITIDGRLRPVYNMASARLLVEPGSFRQITVGADELEGIERGSRVGLDDAPEELPAPDSLDSRHWSACTSESGATSAYIATTPEGMSPLGHALISVDGIKYLIADGVSHEIPQESENAVLLALGIDTESAIAADAAWLNLFSQGARIEPFSVPDVGVPVLALSSSMRNPVSGDLLEVSDASGRKRHYLVQSDGSVARLGEIALAMYQLGNPGVDTQQVDAADLSAATTGASPAPSDWPSALGAGALDDESVCGVMRVDGGEVVPSIGAVSRIAEGGVTVRGGSGALVKATSGGTEGEVFLVTDAGRAWALGGDVDDTLQRLGYTSENISEVPSPWLALVPTGPELSQEAVWKDVADR
ncbi:type VII secretion protein EccB [Actinomyces bowdenii]|uniref:Type VII secretion protein EccB n=1 Tax=Actinomyces bowdenii TaxID=131109 RepID=A0A853EJY5_9ACTO|nr:type VII secretion protein EccB [Actinomyces bowdenii]MBF0697301.1 type VII secretion protein EccB [Actinomyces bowdenii]NYS69474.1 type VII secretion protein EccB [Actinomyces bowdenii]